MCRPPTLPCGRRKPGLSRVHPTGLAGSFDLRGKQAIVYDLVTRTPSRCDDRANTGGLASGNRIQVRIIGSEAAPVWLGTEDHVWIALSIADFARLEDVPIARSLLSSRAAKVFSPAGKRQMAIWTMLNLCSKQRPAMERIQVRAAITKKRRKAATQGRFERGDVIAASARRLGISSENVEEQLFSDLPGERALCFPNLLPDPHSLATQTNLALAQGLLRLASEVDIDLNGRRPRGCQADTSQAPAVHRPTPGA